jgi:hypothetical protein
LEAYQLGSPSDGIEIYFPVAVTQCDPVTIFFNITTGDRNNLDLYSPDETLPFFTLTLPKGVGYVTWTCTVPAGKTFIASNYAQFIYTVQPADGSWCLRDHRVNSRVAQYATKIFSSYTAHHYTQVVLNAQGYVPENFHLRECGFDKCPGRWIIMLRVHTLHCLPTVLREAPIHLSRKQHPADTLFCDSERRSPMLPFGAGIALIVLISVAVVAISSVAIFMIVRWWRRRSGAASQGHNALPPLGHGQVDGSGEDARINGSAETYELGPGRGGITANDRLTPLAI